MANKGTKIEKIYNTYIFDDIDRALEVWQNSFCCCWLKYFISLNAHKKTVFVFNCNSSNDWIHSDIFMQVCKLRMDKTGVRTSHSQATERQRDYGTYWYLYEFKTFQSVISYLRKCKRAKRCTS